MTDTDRIAALEARVFKLEVAVLPHPYVQTSKVLAPPALEEEPRAWVIVKKDYADQVFDLFSNAKNFCEMYGGKIVPLYAKLEDVEQCAFPTSKTPSETSGTATGSFRRFGGP